MAATQSQLRPTTAHVDLSALKQNFRVLRERVGPGVRVLSAVKGDAYGHGAVACAGALAEAGCDAFGVALVEEGAQLRDAGVAGLVLCMGGVGRYGAEEAVARGLTPVVYDEGDADRLNAAARAAGRRLSVHLKVDTGMGRLGVPLPHWERFLDRFAAFDALDIAALMTHFAEADGEGEVFTGEQLRRFRAAAASAQRRGFVPGFLHAANSAGLLRYPESWFGMVRPGIALYGEPPVPTPGLEPVMRVTTRVLFVKDLPTGASVSYGRGFVTNRPSRIATLPVGYADGYPRALSGRASVLVRGQRCPVVGTVCMDLCMADVTEVGAPVESGDEVVLLGGSLPDRIGATEVAGWAGTIPYEVLCGFSTRIPRVHA
jgi:alanine racemase